MKRSRFSEEQIIGISKEQEAGMPTVEVCRRHGASPATFYKWKSKFGGMEVSEAKRLRALEDENAKNPQHSSPVRAPSLTGRTFCCTSAANPRVIAAPDKSSYWGRPRGVSRYGHRSRKSLSTRLWTF